MTIHPFLIKSYRNTSYVSTTPEGQIYLTVGKVNHDLKKLMLKNSVESAAFLTSYNPKSIPNSDLDNKNSLEELRKDIEKLSLKFYSGEGQDPSGQWPAEKSFLILGAHIQQIEYLSDKFQQNAFIWVDNLEGYVSLKLRGDIEVPPIKEIELWKNSLSISNTKHLDSLKNNDIAWIMSVSDAERDHWLNPESWDLNKPWPNALPNGSAMGVGTELDRIFKLIAAGNVRIY